MPFITRAKIIALTGQIILLRSRESINIISRSRESVLCESIHVAGAKTSRNMPIHDKIGLLAQFNARANQCSWESILSDINTDPFLSPFHSAKNREHVRIDPLWNSMNSYDGNDHIRRVRLSLKGSPADSILCVNVPFDFTEKGENLRRRGGQTQER